MRSAPPQGIYPGEVFGRRSQPTDEPLLGEIPAEEGGETPTAQQPKGRPTPSRKDAEQQRKQTLKLPADPKAAKKALKQRERESRMEARAGLMAGDPKYLPARDQGAVKAYVRDFVDRKRRLSEFFIFIAIGILVAGFFRNPQVQAVLSIVWFAMFGLVLLEVVWLLLRMNRELAERWPDPAERKGTKLYMALRLLQIRRLRIPPPAIRPGGVPVQPKGR